MKTRTTALFKAILSIVYYAKVITFLAPMTRGKGVIFMLHQVGPAAPKSFEPNRILRVSPDFLDSVIRYVKRSGFDVISLDELPDRLETATKSKPFVCFTLDDGYRDNIRYAYPIFKRHGIPFTIYLPTDFADGNGDLWWLVLQEAIRATDHVRVRNAAYDRCFATVTDREKDVAYKEIYWWLRSLPETEARAIVADIAEDSGYDPASLCSELVMTWDEARELAKDPLVTFGGHTCQHQALAQMTMAGARKEISDSIQRLEKEFGQPCRHFSFPYGDEESAGEREFELASSLGLVTAVTTRKGHVFDLHRNQMTGLPRLSLNGDFQDLRYVSALLTGVPFAIWNALARLRNAFSSRRRTPPAAVASCDPLLR